MLLSWLAMGLALLLFALPSCRGDGRNGAGEADPPGPPAGGLEVIFLDNSLSEGVAAHRTSILTDPSGALAYVDGIYVGRTPFTLSFAGVHVLTLVNPGQAWHQEIIAPDGTSVTGALPAGPLLTVSLARQGPPLADALQELTATLTPPVLVPTEFGYVADLPGHSGLSLRGGLVSPGGEFLAMVVDCPLAGQSGAGAAVLWLADLIEGQIRRLEERPFGSLSRRLPVPGITLAGWLDRQRLAFLADDPYLAWADPERPESYQPGWRLVVIDVITGAVTEGETFPAYLTGRKLGRCWTTQAGSDEGVFFVSRGPAEDSLAVVSVRTGRVKTLVEKLNVPGEDYPDNLHVSPSGAAAAYGYGFGGMDGRGLYALPGGGFSPGPPYSGGQGPVLTAAPLWSPSSNLLAFIVAEPGRAWTWLDVGDNLLLLGNAIVFSDSRGQTLKRAEETGRLWTHLAWSAFTDTLLAVGVRVSGTPSDPGADMLVRDGLFLIDVQGRYEWAVRGDDAAQLWPFYPQFCPGWFIITREDKAGLSYFLLPEGPGALPGPGSGPAGAVWFPGEPAACLAGPGGGASAPVLISLHWERDRVLNLIDASGKPPGDGSVPGVHRLSLGGYDVWWLAPADRPSPVVFGSGLSPDGDLRLFILLHDRAVKLLEGAGQ